jgi:hypothetical protein
MGEPGVGKTSMFKNIVQRTGFKGIYIDVPNVELGELGIPIPDHSTKTTKIYPNEQWGFHLNEPLVIFADEFTKGHQSVKNMLHPMLNEPRQIMGIPLHPDTIVITAGNYTTDGVGDNMMSHSRNRLSVINIRKPHAGFNVDGSDLATVISSLSPPPISLYDNYWPKLGSWVHVAYFVESFGIIFRSSKVQLINESTYVIAIDGVTPTPTYGGIVFNSDGNFMGTIAMMGPGTAPAGMLKVHGAPLQCEISGIQRATITRCSEGARNKIWTIDPPSGVVAKPTPRPTPTQTTSTVSRELSSAQLTALQAVNRYESAV